MFVGFFASRFLYTVRPINSMGYSDSLNNSWFFSNLKGPWGRKFSTITDSPKLSCCHDFCGFPNLLLSVVWGLVIIKGLYMFSTFWFLSHRYFIWTLKISYGYPLAATESPQVAGWFTTMPFSLSFPFHLPRSCFVFSSSFHRLKTLRVTASEAAEGKRGRLRDSCFARSNCCTHHLRHQFDRMSHLSLMEKNF